MIFFISVCISQYQIAFPFLLLWHILFMQETKEAKEDSRIIDDFSTSLGLLYLFV